MKKLKAYSYIRWSSVSQGESGADSKSRQSKSANAWIEQHGKKLGYELADTFIDAGKSAFKGKHIAKDEYGKAKGELAKFIELAEQGSIPADSILLLDDFSRFSRLEPTKSITLFMQVINSGIGLVFTSSYEKRIINSNLINENGHILGMVVGEVVRTYNESAEKGKKIRAAKQSLNENIKNGICQRNNLPKYFTFIADVPNDPKSRFGKYVHNAKTPLIAKAVEMFLAGKSLYAIADYFNAKKITSIKGKEWSGNALTKIFRNRLLIGEYKGVKNFAPKIIDELEFNQVQNILKGNTYNSSERKGLLNIFSGTAVCAECGGFASVMTSYNTRTDKERKHPYRYIRCNKAHKGTHVRCKNRSNLRLDEMEQEFFVEYLMSHPTQLLSTSDNGELKRLNKAIAAGTVKVNNLTSDIDTFTDLMRTMPIDEFKFKVTRLNAERDTVKTELDELNAQLLKVQDAPEHFQHIQKIITNFRSAIHSGKTLISHKKGVTILGGKEMTEFDDMVVAVSRALRDEYTRQGIRVLLPTLIGKITIDGKKGQFFVFNRMGKMVYESYVQEDERNRSEKWKNSLKRTVKTIQF